MKKKMVHLMDMCVVMSNIFQQISISIPAPGTCGVCSVAGLPTSDFFSFLFLSLPSVYKHGKNKTVEKAGQLDPRRSRSAQAIPDQMVHKSALL